MLKKKVTYVNFNGNTVTDELYFHLSTPEVTKLSIRFGDIQEYAKKLSEDSNVEGMIEFLEALVLGAYGEKSQDGKRFMKSPQIRNEFEYSAAYAELFEELLLKPDEARAFGEGLAQGRGGQSNDKADIIAAYKAKHEEA